MPVITVTETLIAEQCCKCSCWFAMPEDMKDRLKESHDTFYCPKGHPQHYTGKSEAQKLSAKLDIANTQIKNANDRADRERERFEAEKRKVSAQKSAKTRLKNRIHNGVCPCCNRSFANLKNHMKNKHPDYVGSE